MRSLPGISRMEFISYYIKYLFSSLFSHAEVVCSVQPVLFCLFCPACSVLHVLSCQLYPAYSVLLALPCQSCPACSVLPKSSAQRLTIADSKTKLQILCVKQQLASYVSITGAGN